MILDKFTNIFRNNGKNLATMSLAACMSLSSFFNGEKDFLAMGITKVYNVDYYTMADRAYDLYITNEFVRIAINRIVEFAVGKGLELVAEPDEDFLKRKYNIKLDENFTKDIQSIWGLFKTEKSVSANKQNTIDGLAIVGMLNALLAGDCLVIKRIVNSELEYQLVDGRNIRYIGNKYGENDVINGVEVNEKGQPIAYHVYESHTKKCVRIPAYDRYGELTAWLIYADHNRIGSTRGYSVLGAIMQKLDNIGKYTENEVLASKTNAQFAATIEQTKESTGVNPMDGLFSPKKITPSIQEPAQNTSFLDKALKQFKAATNAIIMQLPIGQKLISFDTKRPNVNFVNFLDANMKYAFASIGLPYEVALMVFQSNFSASRASLKMFEMILEIMRINIIVNGFYLPIYKQWFGLEVLKGNINAPKYIELMNAPGYLDKAYIKCKFIGSPIPHIDPVKEVSAVVMKMKNRLITVSGALQELGNKMDVQTLVKRLSEEKQRFKEAGVAYIFEDEKKKAA